MTKKWSSTASMDGRTKRRASKDARAKAKQEYNPEMVERLLRADAEAPEAEFDNVEDMLAWLNGESR